MKTFIHTVNVVSDNEPKKDEFLTDTFLKNNKFRSIYNLNKPEKIYDYSEFVDKCKTIFEELNNLYISRVDIAWDSEDTEYFKNNKKYFRYLLTAFKLAYKSRNSFNVKDLLSDDDKSYWVKTSYFDVTFYNKGLQVEGKDIEETTQARFEFRFKRLMIDNVGKLQEVINIQMKNKIFRTMQYLEDVQDEYNHCLVETYKTGHFRKLTELILVYQDRIFTKRQLINLLNELDETSSDKEKMAENLKYRYKIQFISDKQLKNFVKEIMLDMESFFEDNSQI